MKEKFVYDYLLSCGHNFRVTEDTLRHHGRCIVKNAKAIKGLSNGLILFGIGSLLTLELIKGQQKQIVLLKSRVDILEKLVKNEEEPVTNS